MEETRDAAKKLFQQRGLCRIFPTDKFIRIVLIGGLLFVVAAVTLIVLFALSPPTLVILITPIPLDPPPPSTLKCETAPTPL
jgi:hypothetical protein